MFFFRYTIQIMVKKIFLFAPLQLSSPPKKFLGRKKLEGHFLPPSCTPEITPMPMLGCYIAYGSCCSCRRRTSGSLPGCFVWDCGAQSGMKTGFSCRNFFLFCHYHSSKFINTSVFRRMDSGTIRKRSSTDSLTPSQENEEKL
jgi:hypothetical protein